MVTSADISSVSGAGGIYENNARSVLAAYAPFVNATPDSTVAVVFSEPLVDVARNALEASSAKLGFGRHAVGWVATSCPEGALGPSDLYTLLEGIDPVAMVAVDAGAASLVSAAYSTSLELDSANRANLRTVVAFNNFQRMLSSDDQKQKAWRLLKKLHSKKS